IWPTLIRLAITYPIFMWIVKMRSPTALLVGIGAFSLVGSISFGGFYVALIESLPKQIRGGAFATIYAISIALFGGTCQLIVRWLIHVTGSAMAPAWYMLGATVVGQLALLMIPESAPVRRQL